MSQNHTDVLLPPTPHVPPIRSGRRRLAILVCLVIGLCLFFIWLPHGARAALFSALRVHWELVGMLFLFASIIVSLVWSAGQRLDTGIFLFINVHGSHPVWLDRAMWLATQAGSMVAALLLAGLLFALTYRRVAVEIVLGTLTLWLLVEAIKMLTARARPFLDLEKTRVIGWRERGRSFPSGHTAQTFFLTAVIIHRFHPSFWGITALYAAALLVGFTRMYVGAHYPRDVIGGAVLGSVWGILTIIVDPYWFGRF